MMPHISQHPDYDQVKALLTKALHVDSTVKKSTEDQVDSCLESVSRNVLLVPSSKALRKKCQREHHTFHDGVPATVVGTGAESLILKRDMCDEMERYMSFLHKNWPNDAPVSSSKLAKAGFFYVGVNDTVQCFSCMGRINSWDHGDTTMGEQKGLYPKCKFVGGTDQTSAQESQPHHMSSNVYDFETLHCGGYGHTTHHLQLVISSEPTDLTVRYPEYPHKAYEQLSLETFSQWHHSHNQIPANLSKAVFFATGNDEVKCFYYGGGLKKWEVGDDPWVEHARWFTCCEWLLPQRDPGFVDNVRRKFNQSYFEPTVGIHANPNSGQQPALPLEDATCSKDGAHNLLSSLALEPVTKPLEGPRKQQPKRLLEETQTNKTKSSEENVHFQGHTAPPQPLAVKQPVQGSGPILVIHGQLNGSKSEDGNNRDRKPKKGSNQEQVKGKLLRQTSYSWSKDWLSTLLLLLLLLQPLSVFSTEVCPGNQTAELGGQGYIRCNFPDDYNEVHWFDDISEITYPVISYRPNDRGKSGQGLESGAYDVHQDGSLIIANVSTWYERSYKAIVYFEGSLTHATFVIPLTVIVLPSPPYIQITGCDDVSRQCVIKENSTKELTCAVYGARPNVTLQWIAEDGEDISFIDHKPVFKERGETADTILSVEMEVSQNVMCGEEILIKCRLNGPLSTIMKAESTALVNPASCRENEVKDHGLNGAFIAVVILYGLLIVFAVCLIICCIRGNRTIATSVAYSNGGPTEDPQDASLQSGNEEEGRQIPNGTPSCIVTDTNEVCGGLMDSKEVSV